MVDIVFGGHQLTIILRACAWVRLPLRTPEYFQRFIANRLWAMGYRRLALRVARLDAGRFESLCNHIRERQPILLRPQPAAAC